LIQLEQIKTLEQKVKQAVGLISQLKSENEFLKSRLSDYEVRIQELESLINSFRSSQSEIEEGIKSALEELDNLDSSTSPDQSEALSAVEAEQEPSLPEDEEEPYSAQEDLFLEAALEPDPEETPEESPAAEQSETEEKEEPSLGIF
jgi:chromosome segregation ATPase